MQEYQNLKIDITRYRYHEYLMPHLRFANIHSVQKKKNQLMYQNGERIFLESEKNKKNFVSSDM